MSKNDSEFDILIKLVIIGDSGVGKSNYLIRFVEGQFNPIHEATIGFDYKSKICILPKSKKKIKFQIWDTAGQEKYMSINKNLFQRVQGIILMYDITEKKTFDNLRHWINTINQLAGEIPLILIGNKIDLVQERIIPKEKGEQFANDNNIKFFESSGKNGENVDESFFYLGEQIVAQNYSEGRQTISRKRICHLQRIFKKKKEKKVLLNLIILII